MNRDELKEQIKSLKLEPRVEARLLKMLDKAAEVDQPLREALANELDKEADKHEKIANREDKIAAAQEALANAISNAAKTGSWTKLLNAAKTYWWTLFAFLIEIWIQKPSSSEPKEVPADVNAPPKEQSPYFTSTDLFASTAAFILVLSLWLAISEASSYLWRPISILLYGILMLVAIFFSATTLLSEAAEDSSVSLPFVLVGAIATLISFSQISRHLYLLFGGFVANQTGYWHWVRFGIAKFLDSVLFDASSIYQWKVSEIMPTTFWSSSLLFLFNLGIEFWVLTALLREFRFARKGWRKLRLDRNENFFEFLIVSFGRLLLIVLWVFPIVIGIYAIIREDLSIAIAWSIIRLGIPVVFSIWLIWQCLRAFAFIFGKWNKLFALIGIIMGIWLIYETGPALLAFLNR